MIPGLQEVESRDPPSADTKTAPKNTPATGLDQTSIAATKSRGPISRRGLPAISGIALVLGAGVAWASLNFGSVRDAWLYAGGARVMIRPAVAMVKDGRAGDAREAVFLVRNLADRTVNVLGVTTSCTCISADKPNNGNPICN